MWNYRLNEKFVVYGALVQILAILRSPCAKPCYLKQKLEPAFERVYMSQYFGNIFIHNFIY